MAIDFDKKSGNESESPDFLNEFSFDGMPPENVSNFTGTDNVNADNINIDGGVNTGVGGVAFEKPSADSNLKPRVPDLPPDFFTLLLGLALVMMIIASILLFLEVNSYGPDPLSGLPRL
ncbi:MAG: hypothetical protein LBC74_15005 [Planctomycetaceae bacterium]|jgi:hypothetical protein|nr:hypothetical protein [Planctomycetaceae bacterium]